MIKSLLKNKLSLSFLTILCAVLPFNPAQSVTFQETEVTQEEFIAVAQPFGENKYNLIVIEQIPGKNNCWSESGANPVNVELLLANFDFSGHCRRSTDANGYSIRYDNQDFGLDYILNLVPRDGNLLLMGYNRREPGSPPIVVGSTRGLSASPTKIILNPGWRFTKRTYDGKVLGHVYFSYNSASAGQNTTPMMENQNTTPSNLNNTVENVNEEQIRQQGTVQEIIAPEVQPQKEIDKPLDNSKGTIESRGRNLSQTRWQRLRN